MTTQNYTRAVSTEEKLVKIKDVESLYWYFLSIAKYEHKTKTLYIVKSDLDFDYIKDKTTGLGYSNGTYYRKIAALKKVEVIKEEQYKGHTCYILNQPTQYALIDQETIKFLLDNVRIHVLKTYAYLKFLSSYNDTKGNASFNISPSTLLTKALGLTKRSKTNIDAVYNAMEFLQLLGLVSYEVMEIEGKFGGADEDKRAAHVFEVYDVLQKSDLVEGK